MTPKNIKLPLGSSFAKLCGYIAALRNGLSLVAEAVDAKAEKTIRIPVTLPAAGWSGNEQTVQVNGVSSDESAQLIQPVPSTASREAYYAAGILCTGQMENALTFTAQTVPPDDLLMYVTITEVSAG